MHRQAMGAGQGKETGFHIILVHDASPAAEAGLQPYYDFITSVNGVRVVRAVRGGRTGTH